MSAGQVGDIPSTCLFPQPQFLADLPFVGTGSFYDQSEGLRDDVVLRGLLYCFGVRGIDRVDSVPSGGLRLVADGNRVWATDRVYL